MNIAIILSGGTGVRLGGDIPKQYIEVNGRPVIANSIDTFENHDLIDKYVIVAAEEWQEYVHNYIVTERQTTTKFAGFASPGDNRQLSIYNGLKLITVFANDNDVVIVHDAARPFVSVETITALINACEVHDGAMPALPVKDTMYIQENGRVKSLIDRESLIAGQAPEAFILGKYLTANEALMPNRILDIKGSTEPAFLAGMDITVIPGDEKNFKITTKDDLDKYIEIVR